MPLVLHAARMAEMAVRATKMMDCFFTAILRDASLLTVAKHSTKTLAVMDVRPVLSAPCEAKVWRTANLPSTRAQKSAPCGGRTDEEECSATSMADRARHVLCWGLHI